MSEKILLVDDESNVLDAYRRNLRKQFTISTAESGAEALETINKEGPFAVIVSDMRMPEMDGVAFLSKAKKIAPGSIRMMLTGNADQQTAIDAVNKGDVFKFLNKPCSPEEMAKALTTAIKQYLLSQAEKELLENTLKGSIETLAEVLSLTSPNAFGRTTRLKRYMSQVATKMGLGNIWELESAALLSLMGCVTLPDELTKKVTSLTRLNEEESTLYEQHPLRGAQLIEKIPRMKTVAGSIKYQHKYFDGSGFPEDDVKGELIPTGARILRVLLDFDLLESAGLHPSVAIEKLEGRSEKYDPKVVAALKSCHSESGDSEELEVTVHQVEDNMILAQDVVTNTGALLMCKGQKTTPSVKARLVNSWQGRTIGPKVRVLVDKSKP